MVVDLGRGCLWHGYKSICEAVEVGPNVYLEVYNFVRNAMYKVPLIGFKCSFPYLNLDYVFIS